MGKKYYNPNSFPVGISTAEGGRLVLHPVQPGKQPETVEGEYYGKLLVDRGTLAEWTDEVAKKYKDAYLAGIRSVLGGKARVHPPKPKAPPAKPSKVALPNTIPEEEIEKMAREPVFKDKKPAVGRPKKEKLSDRIIDPAELAMMEKKQFEVLTIKELRKMIKKHDYMGSEPADKTKKDDIINQILGSVTTKKKEG